MQPRVHRVWRLGSRASIMAIALIATCAVADAPAAVVPLPRVSSETEETRSGGRPAIILHSLLVRRINGKLSVRCNRCRRLVGRGRVRSRRTSATTRRYSDVNWILHGGRAVKLTVVRRGRIGRYLLLTAKRRDGILRLGYKGSGCLDRHRNRVLCPRDVPPVQPDQVVVPAPPQATPTPVTPAPSGTATTPPPAGWNAVTPANQSSVLCGGAVTVAGANNAENGMVNGNALIRACLVYLRNSSGTYYYQGRLEVRYNETWPGASDLFSGKSMAVTSSTGMATSIRDCPRIAWSNGTVLWCYSPTVRFSGRGEKLYAKGVLIDYAGSWHPVWSPSITTE